MLASFMEKRGLEKEFEEAFEPQLADIQKVDTDIYWEIISTFFMGDLGAPNFALKHLTKWAGEDEARGHAHASRRGGAVRGDALARVAVSVVGLRARIR